MQASISAIRSDRVSSSAILVAGLLCGVTVFFVALPLAQSSPFPVPRDGGWVAEDTPPAPASGSYQLATASTTSYKLASASLQPVAPPSASSQHVVSPRKAAQAAMPDHIGAQAAIEWEAMTKSSGVLELPVAKAVRDDAEVARKDSATPRSWPRVPNPEAATAALVASVTPAVTPAEGEPKRAPSAQEQVDEYLWEVYQRSPIKKDGTGDFTWKDPAAAKRVKMSLKDYVIGGMDSDFRETLYHAGKAMDAEGLRWSMLSAFRDDYRQGIASGLKARVGNSLHGGSRATGGYGNGRAADIVNTEGEHSAVWRWIDRNGAKYGLARPMPGYDPAHVQARGGWHTVATALRKSRTGTTAVAAAPAAPPVKTKVARAGR
jgi:hypothetical protein